MNNHFERLGLPRRFALSLAEIEQNYLLRHRAVHPDYHQTGSTSQQQASLDAASSLNEAYQVLRDPFRRAEYLLELAGGPGPSASKQMPLEFLEETLELRMQIESIKGQPAESTEFSQIERQLQARKAKFLQDVEKAFDKLDSTPPNDPKQGPIRDQIRQTLNALKFVQGLIRDLDQT